ncbi:MAG: aminotransferase class I/II-fold pyridoxal phosphate-dependent enzyme, partial [Flavobacteriaceae bacterium]|nr:aminotransferase class I/II-fold pyridoxal phosphate-dependent enzyme [Flavobacteriaceae bacterium]
GVLAALNDVTNEKVEMKADFTLNLKAIYQALDANTKLVFICSPNNPTGNSIPVQQIKELLLNFKGLVIIDEAYIDFSEQESWVMFLDIYPNLVVTQTFSKAYGMAGIRLGSCYASEEVIAVLNKIKPPYNVNELTQAKAMERLGKYELIQQEIESLRAERAKLEAAMAPIPFVTRIYKSDANFILAEVDDADKRYEELLNDGFIVRNRSNQPLCNNCLRFTIGTPSENDRLIAALNELK